MMNCRYQILHPIKMSNYAYSMSMNTHLGALGMGFDETCASAINRVIPEPIDGVRSEVAAFTTIMDDSAGKFEPMIIFARRRSWLWMLTVLLILVHGWWAAAESGLDSTASSRHFVTNAAEFQTLSGIDYLEGCDFRLSGVVTLVDTNRSLVVLQDMTGAVALNYPLHTVTVSVGQSVILFGTNYCPLFSRFPDFPHRPSGWDIREEFEAPVDWGEYHLTRMRGYLRPPVTGDYTFWIASDNSSELWLSADASAAKVRRIAAIARFDWVPARQWTKFPSQRSGTVRLDAGKVYYLEALQEQAGEGDNLSVAWQIPSPNNPAIEVISGRYVTPWDANQSPTVAPSSGVLREYWTNFTAGDLTGLGGARPFESALSAKEILLQQVGSGALPKPEVISLSQPLPKEWNYRWVQVEGVVKFVAADEQGGFLEISDGLAIAQVRMPHWRPELLRGRSNVIARVEGVCEGVYDQSGSLVPGLIWASTTNGVSILETSPTNMVGSEAERPPPSVSTSNQTMQGFYGTLAVVTFNDRVFDEDYIFIQEDAAVMRVNIANRPFKNQMKVGQRVDLGGLLEPGKAIQMIKPVYVANLGRRSLPAPITQPLGPFAGNREGRWSELEGLVHAVNSNGTLSVVTRDGLAYLWLGQTPSEVLSHYVDAKLRVRGVLMTTILDAPTLLVPSRSFVAVEEEAPESPFEISQASISQLLAENKELWRSHRIRVICEVTYRDEGSFFIQDATGGIRVRSPKQSAPNVGEWVEVIAFPALNDSVHALTEPQFRPTSSGESIRATDLNLSEALSSKQSGALVQVNATLLAQRTNGLSRVLELQERQRVFTATLDATQGQLPDLIPGSQLRIIGVRDDETTAPSTPGEKSSRSQLLATLNILLRTPQDVTVISGPPWWTWKRTVTLVGALLTVLVGALLRVYLLHRRLERQKTAQLIFSRQVLERLEGERSRIAANLHDSLGQTLLVIKNYAMIALMNPSREGMSNQRLTEISETTSQAIEEVRRITHGLRPYQLDRLGLTQAVRTAIDVASKNASIEFASRVEDIDGLFNKDNEIHIYRIVQEAISNAVKHSAATEAAVVIKRRPTTISLSIRDNGRGFDRAKFSDQLHDLGYGLTGIAERVRILGGTVTIDSRPGAGTVLTAEVPIPISKA